MRRDEARQHRAAGPGSADLQLDEDGCLPLDPDTGLPAPISAEAVVARAQRAADGDDPRAQRGLRGAARGVPAIPEEQMFQIARLVVSALIAKIHTVEWTPAILARRPSSWG